MQNSSSLVQEKSTSCQEYSAEFNVLNFEPMIIDVGFVLMVDAHRATLIL